MDSLSITYNKQSLAIMRHLTKWHGYPTALYDKQRDWDWT